MSDYIPIAESNNFIVLEKYSKIAQQGGNYQTEADLE
jgi:type I restriction enzyme, R subunit